MQREPVTEILLSAPYVVPHTQREVTGKFKASPSFRLVGNAQFTPLGMITVPEGHPGVRIEAEIRGAPHLDVNSPDWTVGQVRGIHLARCDDVVIRNTVIEDVPLEAILAGGIQGLDVSHSHARRCLTFLSVHYYSGPVPRRNQDVVVHGHCSAADLRTRKGAHYPSQIDPRFDVAGAAIYFSAVEDGEVVDFLAGGENNGTFKNVDGRRIRVARTIGTKLQSQGSCYWDAERGPHSISNGQQLPWPLGPGSYARDVTFEDNEILPDMRLTQGIGGHSIQLSWPQEGTRVLRNKVAWEPDKNYPATQFACIQLAEGVNAEIRGNVFYKTDPTNHHGIWNAPGNINPPGGSYGDSAPAKWPSRIVNDDWRTSNEFRP